ncbi:MAG: methyltransferase domain-containing protein [Bacteroidaceae bacterium]|nr:methyltransferase domain-containing protein [Bacteroidaceae bacterium]
MNNTVTNKEKDPMGRAIFDYHTTGNAAKLRVFSSMFYEDEIPVPTLFRTFDEMPVQEKKAIELCNGRVLDVGAGSGCHSAVLMERGLEVVAIDISELSVEVMKQRGIDARLINFFDEKFTEKFDTILLAMNGIGITGKTNRLADFFRSAKRLLAPEGQILLDSSDIKYVFMNDDGSMDIDLAAGYYGEIDYKMRYKNITSKPFDWLYIDFDTLSMYAEEHGFTCEKCIDGEHYDYLARIIPAQQEAR